MTLICHVTCTWVMSRVNERSFVWMSHVRCENVMSQAGLLWCWASWNGWMSYGMGLWVMLHVIESCCMWLSHVACDWVMSSGIESCPMWLSHVIGMFLEALHAAYEPSEVPSSVLGRGGMDLKLKGGKMHAKMLVRFSRMIFNCSMTRFLRYLWHDLIRFVT